MPLIDGKNCTPLNYDQVKLFGKYSLCLASDESRVLVTRSTSASGLHVTVFLKVVVVDTAGTMAVSSIRSAPDDSMLLCSSDLHIPVSKVFSQLVRKAYPPAPIGVIVVHCISLSPHRSAYSDDQAAAPLDGGKSTPRVRNCKVSSSSDVNDSLDVGECRQVERIRVRRGTKPRLQMLGRRAERCGVFENKALVTRYDDQARLSENQSAKISNAFPLSKSGRA